jgi:hypothetical protein
MSLHRRNCYIVACDVCHTEYTDPETDAVAWFPDEATAEQILRADRWMVLARHLPERFICPTDDEAHHALVDSLMPPEPVMQISGQLGFDGTEEPSR